MIHLNQEMQRIRRRRISDLDLAQMYDVSSVGDFLEHRYEIRATRAILFPGLTFYGKAIVRFHDINYRREERGSIEFRDGTWAVKVEFHPFYSGDYAETIPFGSGKFYESIALYKPHADRLFLLSIENGPPQSVKFRQGVKLADAMA